MGLYYGRPGDNTFETLMAQMPDQEFGNLTRSTIPLLSWWQDVADNWKTLAPLGLGAYADGDLCLEYPVPSLGRAKASFTDAMFIAPSASAAFEAKSTEPRYETVAEWLAKGGDNRQRVLQHWLDFIQPWAGEIDQERVSQCVYQMVHRTASVCSLAQGKTRHVVYQYFAIEGAPPSRFDYRQDLADLAQALSAGEHLRFWLLTVPTKRTERWEVVTQQVKNAEDMSERAELVRAAILGGALFEFGQAAVEQVSV